VPRVLFLTRLKGKVNDSLRSNFGQLMPVSVGKRKSPCDKYAIFICILTYILLLLVPTFLPSLFIRFFNVCRNRGKITNNKSPKISAVAQNKNDQVARSSIPY
jgi:hypothetical protein